MSSSDQSLLQFRTEIDAIDQQLVELINQRAELTVDLLQRDLDATNALIANHQFEPMVLRQVAGKNRGPIPNTALEGIYHQILNGSFELARPTRVGYLGPFGTFSHLAAAQYFGEGVDYENLRTLEGVFEEVSRGHVDFGLVPIENSTGGAIIETLDSFSRYLGRITICGEIRLAVQFCLLSKCARAKVKTIYSKAEALAQCHDWLVKHYPDAQRIPYESTAAAVEFAYLADPNDGVAAVGSSKAGQLYDLNTLHEGIATRSDNVTRFLILSTKETEING